MKTYVFSRADGGPKITVIDSVPVPGRPKGRWTKEYALHHVVKHSPTGMLWGYAGSGPADCALSILTDCLGPQQAEKWYQDFKWEFLAGMPSEGGMIMEEAIREFIDRKEAEYLATYSK